MDELHRRFNKTLAELSRESDTAEAIRYTFSRLRALCPLSCAVTHTRVWRSAGYIVVSADSIGEAIDHFNAGDFELVVLGDSISIESRQRLTSLIRASGSQKRGMHWELFGQLRLL